ncbi:MAG: hypothetical protein V5A64_06000 [Candidatus Thermoplasmatota archaeon]
MDFKHVENNEAEKQSPVNWWKEINDELPEILENLKGTVLLLHNSAEFTDIIDVLNNIQPDNCFKILYISMIRSYGYMKKTLKLNPLNKDLSVVDCVSGYAFPQEEGIDNCMYHKPPRNLMELKKILDLGVKKEKPDIVVLDSLSHFINFSKPHHQDLLDLYHFLDTIEDDMVDDRQSTFLLLYDSKMSTPENIPREGIQTTLKMETKNSDSPIKTI